MERLSSGKRINSASDDAAGLAISNRITSQVRGLSQAIRNANDGVSMIQTAEGALDTSSNLLQRMRELAIQSSNGTYSDSNRITLNAEYSQLVEELDRIGGTTNFNGRKLFDGSSEAISLQVGEQSGQLISFGLEELNAFKLGISSTDTALAGTALNIDASSGLLDATFKDAISINAYALKAGEAGETVQVLLDEINSYEGISAVAEVDITASKVGNGTLLSGQILQIQSFDLNGEAKNFEISGGTTSLVELANKITADTEGYIIARVDKDGYLNLYSQSAATIRVGDPTGDTATGIENPGIYDADIAKVIEGLQHYNWVGEVETLIDEYFGLSIDPADIALNIYNDADDQRLAYVSSSITNFEGGNYSLNINMAYYSDIVLPDGTTSSGQISLERLIAHELVHAVFPDQLGFLTAQLPDNTEADGLNSFLPSWFTEGFPELIAGADERVINDFSSAGSLLASSVFTNAWAAVVDPASSSPDSSAKYSASYLGAKILTDGVLASGNTLREFFDKLQTDTATAVSAFQSSGDSATLLSAMDLVLSDAINTYTDWTSLNDFETWVSTNGYAYLQDAFDNGGGGTLTIAAPNDLTVLSNFQDADIGSIAGSDYSSTLQTIDASVHAAVTNRDADSNGEVTALELLPNSTTSSAGDFSVVYPDQYSGEFAIFNARLRFNSDDKTEIRIAADKGQEAILSDFGFAENNILQVDELTEFVSTFELAQSAIGKIDAALDRISEVRSNLGAVANRLQFTTENLSNVVENTIAARSRIMDADYSAESASLSRAQILQRAGTAMLAQANTQPRQVISLIR